MTIVVTVETGCDDVRRIVASAITARHQMLDGGLHQSRLAWRDLVPGSESGGVLFPHRLLAIIASPALAGGLAVADIL